MNAYTVIIQLAGKTYLYFVTSSDWQGARAKALAYSGNPICAKALAVFIGWHDAIDHYHGPIDAQILSKTEYRQTLGEITWKEIPTNEPRIAECFIGYKGNS